VVGEVQTTHKGILGFLFSGGKATFLTLGGEFNASCTAIGVNNEGYVVGTCLGTRNHDYEGFLYFPNGTLLGLGQPSSAENINSAGDVVGMFKFNGENHAALYSGGKWADLGTLPGGDKSVASAANNLVPPQVVGCSTRAKGGGNHAFLYADGVMKDLGTLPGGDTSFATDVNDMGWVVGYSQTRSNDNFPFLYKNGSMQAFAGSVKAVAMGINNAGQIVGQVSGTYGFLYTDGKLLDLNTLVPPSNVTIISATAINSLGQIAATGESMGSEFALLLQPL